MEGAGTRRRKPTSRYEAFDYRTSEEYQIRQAMLLSLQETKTNTQASHQHAPVIISDSEREGEGGGWSEETGKRGGKNRTIAPAAEGENGKTEKDKRRKRKEREASHSEEDWEEEEEREYGRGGKASTYAKKTPKTTAQHNGGVFNPENSTRGSGRGRKQKSSHGHKVSGVRARNQDDRRSGNFAFPRENPPGRNEGGGGPIVRQNSGFQPWPRSNGFLSGRVSSERDGLGDAGRTEKRGRDFESGDEERGRNNGRNPKIGMGKKQKNGQLRREIPKDVWEFTSEDGNGESKGVSDSEESPEKSNSEENLQGRKYARTGGGNSWGKGNGTNGNVGSGWQKRHHSAPIKPTPIRSSENEPYMINSASQSPDQDDADNRRRKSMFKPIKSPHKKRQLSIFDSSSPSDEASSEGSEIERDRNRNGDRDRDRSPDSQSSEEDRDHRDNRDSRDSRDEMDYEDVFSSESEEAELVLSRERPEGAWNRSESYSGSEKERESISRSDDYDRSPSNRDDDQSHGSDSETSDRGQGHSQSPQSYESEGEDGGYNYESVVGQPIPPERNLGSAPAQVTKRDDPFDEHTAKYIHYVKTGGKDRLPFIFNTPACHDPDDPREIVNYLERVMSKAQDKERPACLLAADEGSEPLDTGFEMPEKCPLRFAARKQTINWLAHRGGQNEVFRAFIFDRMEKKHRSKLVCDLVELDIYALSQIEYRLLQEGIANDASGSEAILKHIRMIPKNAEPTESKLQTLRHVVQRAIDQLVSFHDEWNEEEVKEKAKRLAQDRRLESSSSATNQSLMSVDTMGKLSVFWLDNVTDTTYMPNKEMGHLDTMAYYWRYVDPLAPMPDQHIVVYHAPCVDISLLAQSPGLKEKVWDYMTASADLRRQHPHLIGPHLQVGMTFSTRYWSCYNHDCFIDYMHTGGPRAWFVVQPKYAQRMRDHVVTVVDGEEYTVGRMEEEDIPFQVAPWHLSDAGIEVWTDVQNEKDFFVVLPGSYFMHVDCGRTISEYCLGNFKPPTSGGSRKKKR